MNDSVGSLNIEVQLQMSKLQAQFDTLNQHVHTGNQHVVDEFKKMREQVKGVLESLAPAASAAGIIELGKAAIENAEHLKASAEAARMSTDSYQTLSSVARESGVGMDQLTRGLDTMEKKIEDAAMGVAEAQKPFKDLGLNWNALAKLSPDRQFEAVAKAVAGATDQNRAFDDAMTIMGTKSAPHLLDVMNQLSGGLDALTSKEKAAGQVMDESMIFKLAQLDMAVDRVFTRIKNAFGEDIAFAAAAFGNSINDFQVRIVGFEQKLAEAEADNDGGKRNDEIEAYSNHIRKLQEELAALERRQAEVSESGTTLNKGYMLQARAAKEARDAAEALAVADKRIADEAAYQAGMDKVYIDVETQALKEEAEQDKKVSAEKNRMYEQTRTAAEKFAAELEKINELTKQGLDLDTAARAANAAGDEFQKNAPGFSDEDTARIKEQIRLATDLGTSAKESAKEQKQADQEVKDSHKELIKASDELAHSIASTFVSGVENGEKFRKIIQNLIGDIAKMIIQLEIEKPLQSGLSSMFSGLFGAGGGSAATGAASTVSATAGATDLPAISVAGMAAGGGGLEPNLPYLTGEDGPEVVVPNSNSTVIPNGSAATRANADDGDSAIHIHYNITSGVTRNELSPILDRHASRIKGDLANAGARGGTPARLMRGY